MSIMHGETKDVLERRVDWVPEQFLDVHPQRAERNPSCARATARKCRVRETDRRTCCAAWGGHGRRRGRRTDGLP